MRLVRYGRRTQERPAVVLDHETALDVSSVVDDFDQQFFASGGLEQLRRHLSGETTTLPRIDLTQQRLGSPVAKPYHLLCIGLNHRDNAEDTGQEIPGEPVLFTKGPATVVGPYDDVLIPPGSTRTDWEIELAAVIGAPARYLPDEAAARECIAGYTISNDISERTFQFDHGGQWVKGKSCETFSPLGPWLVTPDELGDVQALALRLTLNDELMQEGSTSNMAFSVERLVWYLSPVHDPRTGRRDQYRNSRRGRNQPGPATLSCRGRRDGTVYHRSRAPAATRPAGRTLIVL